MHGRPPRRRCRAPDATLSTERVPLSGCLFFSDKQLPAGTKPLGFRYDSRPIHLAASSGSGCRVNVSCRPSDHPTNGDRPDGHLSLRRGYRSPPAATLVGSAVRPESAREPPSRTGPDIAGSAAAIVVAYERESRFGVSDASRAIQGMILTAWGDGVGYIPSTYADNDRSATASACTPAHLRPGRSGMEGKAVERPIDRSLRPVSRQAGKLQLVCRHRPHDGAVVHVVIRPEQLLRVNGGAKPARHDPTKCALKGGCVAGVHEHRLAEHGQIATTRPVFIGLADRLR